MNHLPCDNSENFTERKNDVCSNSLILKDSRTYCVTCFAHVLRMKGKKIVCLFAIQITRDILPKNLKKCFGGLKNV
jgi:hypothetical protein